jgi:hypothetical protein
MPALARRESLDPKQPSRFVKRIGCEGDFLQVTIRIARPLSTPSGQLR